MASKRKVMGTSIYNLELSIAKIPLQMFDVDFVVNVNLDQIRVTFMQIYYIFYISKVREYTLRVVQVVDIKSGVTSKGCQDHLLQKFGLSHYKQDAR